MKKKFKKFKEEPVQKRPTKEELEKEYIYFAYGSNMYTKRLCDRVGKVRCLGVQIFHDYKFMMNHGYRTNHANIMPSVGDFVIGVCYVVTGYQLHILDSFEGVHSMNGYDRFEIAPSVITYVSKFVDPDLTEPQISLEYYAYLVLGMKEHGISDEYANSLQLESKVNTRCF